MIDARLLGAELERLEVHSPEATQARLLQYVTALEHWNRRINLTNLRGGDLVRRLVAEPLWIAHQLQLSGKLADIGSGNGSPGIPLAVGSPVSVTHLVESRARRAAFLRQMVIQMELKSVFVHHTRAESLALEVVAPVDWITFQAVRPETPLLRALQPLASATTTVVWITSIDEPPVAPAHKLAVPNGATCAWLFHLTGEFSGAF